jgi:hypothetical protein
MAATGWVGHIDAPENDHVDPGKLNYRRLFQLAGATDDIGAAPVKPKPRKKVTHPVDAVDRWLLNHRAAKHPPAGLCLASKETR